MARYNPPPSYSVNAVFLYMVILLGLLAWQTTKVDEGDKAYENCIEEHETIHPNAKGILALGIIKQCELIEQDVRGW